MDLRTHLYEIVIRHGLYLLRTLISLWNQINYPFSKSRYWFFQLTRTHYNERKWQLRILNDYYYYF